MDITLADERAFVLVENLTMDQAEGRAWTQKIDAFGSLIKFTTLISRPKDNDFELVYKEHRYQPFWHIEARADYIYERDREYPLPAASPDVQKLTITGQEYPVRGGKIVLQALEHCEEHVHKEVLIEGYNSEINEALREYTDKPATAIETERLDDFFPAGTVVVPPQARASAILRDTLIDVMRSVKADRILEDRVEVVRIDLYYRPVYAFQYRWISKQKETVIELDAVTGKMVSGGKTFQQYVGKFLDPDFLFDVGIDTVDLFVPGGGLAVKLAKKGFEAVKKRS